MRSRKRDLLDSFRMIVRYALLYRHRIEFSLELGAPVAPEIGKRKRGKKLPRAFCLNCLNPLGRLYACIHCVYIGCWRGGHIQAHLVQRDHIFAVDFERCLVHCRLCNDFIYSHELDKAYAVESRRIHDMLTQIYEPGLKRARYVDWRPSEEEAGLIRARTRIQACGGLRGLRNMGNTCFMSVILQAFIHNPLLRTYFLSDRHPRHECRRENCLSCELDRLFSEFHSGRKEPFNPGNFLQVIWRSSSELAGYAQQDAHEFFISALNQLHISLEGSSMDACRCVVHATFAGELQSDVTCLACDNVTTVIDPMLDISLDLNTSAHRPHGRPLKSSSLASSHHTNGADKSSDDHANSLLGCLERFTQAEKLDATEYTCSKCGNNSQSATKQMSIRRLPPVLSFQFKRFEHSQNASKIESHIRFPETLDMTQFTSRARGANAHKSTPTSSPACQYRLYAVVCHQGKLDNGHYTAYARCRDQWFYFDDTMITLTDRVQVLASKAYMCFYTQARLDYTQRVGEEKA
ncbi:hypothetical protein BDF19DRAFT_396612 [Syncephalis fuscata]|nr:hypothetical protein BDF19DRAFT_396612 [Syncephalis fuscata]